MRPKRPSLLFSNPNITSIRTSSSYYEVSRDDELSNVQNPDVKTFELQNSYLNGESIALLVAKTPNVISLSIDLKFPCNKMDRKIDAFLD
jgi:hypothetical protein